MIKNTIKMRPITHMIILIMLAFCFQTAIAAGQPLIQTDKDIYNYGEEIMVHFYNAPGYARDWLCIVPVGSLVTEAGDYKYMPEGVGQGVLTFKSPRPGQYEARAYYNYSPLQYIVTARYRFKIEGEVSGYDDQYGSGYGDEYVDVPIVYGEPYYIAPPITVMYPYDYYTYEMVGGFVDIVFWRGGHRYRSEHWQNHGRRVSDADIRSRKWHQRVRGSEFNQYREKLRQNHNISHPDSYYGMKSSLERQLQQRPQQVEQRTQWGQQPQQTQQKPVLGQRQSQQVQRQPRRLQQRPPSAQRQSQQVQRQPRQLQQRPQSGQRQSQQIQQQPRRLEQRPQSGQGQSRQVKERSQSQKQRPRQVE
jgi:hypothetical protein